MRFFEHGLTHGTKIRLGESPTGVFPTVFVLFEVFVFSLCCVVCFTDTTVLCCLSVRY